MMIEVDLFINSVSELYILGTAAAYPPLLTSIVYPTALYLAFSLYNLVNIIVLI